MIHEGYKNDLISNITKAVNELEQLKHCLELEQPKYKEIKLTDIADARRYIGHIAEYIDAVGEQHKDVYIYELKLIDDFLAKTGKIVAENL